MSLPSVRRLVAERVDGLPPDPSAVALALTPLVGARRLSALSGVWSGTPFLLTADPQQVREHRAPPGTSGTGGDGPDRHVLRLTDVTAVLDAARVPTTRGTAVPPGAVGGGWVTLLGHALGRLSGRVRTPEPPTAGPVLPVLLAAFHDHVLRFDGTGWWAEALESGDGSAVARARALAEEARSGLERSDPPDPVPPRAPVRLEQPPDAAAHMVAVEQVVTAIRAGDIAQANVCTRFGLRLANGKGAALQAWVDLVRALGPDRAAFVSGPWGALVGASPELYLGMSGGVVRSAPIKGTRPAGDGPALLASTKDASENVMIVDLVRNDLSRVCEPGTVAVDDLLAVQAHAGVAHLVSQVSGRLLPGAGPGQVVAATFPPGSVTGTPKQRATEVTDALEPAARGAHTGAVGFLGPFLGDLAVTIRSLEVDVDGRASLGVGGGIVADSTPAEEWHEVLTKAAPLLRALGVAALETAPTTAARKGLADPAEGLLETVLAVDGRAVEVADHVARLQRSAWELTGSALDTDVRALLEEAARTAGPGAHRLRVRVPLPGAPGTNAAPALLEVEPFVRPLPVQVSPGLLLHVAPAPVHGLERHKYADRSWVGHAQQRARARLEDGPDAPDDAARPDDVVCPDDVVLAAADGTLLETTRACLLVVLRGARRPVLLTPPCDGRVLPGVTRQVCVDLAHQLGWGVQLAAVDADVLDRAQDLLTCNALRGVQWVRTLQGRVWDRPSAGAVELSQALLHRWRLG